MFCCFKQCTHENCGLECQNSHRRVIMTNKIEPSSYRAILHSCRIVVDAGFQTNLFGFGSV